MNSKRELLRRGRRCSFLSVLLGAVTVLAGCGREPAPTTQVLEAVPAPSVESACGDGIDNDRDGTVACADVDCQSPGGECRPAPQLDRTLATTLAESEAYLYMGPNPLQKGVAANALDSKQIAMLRGKTVDESGKPLAGVKVTVNGRPEYGYVYSRGDGAFDMAVNGGAQLTLSYDLVAHLPVERSVRPGWQRCAVVPDVGCAEDNGRAMTTPA